MASLVTTVLLLCMSAKPVLATDLFSASDLRHWEVFTSPAVAIGDVAQINAEGVITIAGQPSGYISTRDGYQNFRLHAEWRWPLKPGNSGVLIYIASGPKDRVWPLSLQIQTKYKFSGDLLPMAGATFAEDLSSPPGSATPVKAKMQDDSEKPAGEWNSCDIVSMNGAVEVSINGVVQNRISKSVPYSGRVGFQLEGTVFELRNVQIDRLD